MNPADLPANAPIRDPAAGLAVKLALTGHALAGPPCEEIPSSTSAR